MQTSGLECYSHGHISMNNVSASWSTEKVTLNEIDLNIDKGKLYAVIGSVGAGKVYFNCIISIKFNIQII